MPICFEELKEIITPIAARYGVERVVLFGSYARGDATGQSDVDLLVFGGEGFRPTRIYAMAEEVRAALNKDVDMYEIREIDPGTPFHQTILREGREIA